MDAPDKLANFLGGTIASPIGEAEHDEELATGFSRAASYMADHAKPLAVGLFQRLSRYHGIRALEKRVQAALCNS